MEHLSWMDVVGPFLTTFSAIIALSGNPYNEKKKWFARLNWRGYCIALLIVLSVCISMKNTSVVNATNDIKVKIEKDRYDSVSAKYDSIKNELSASTRSGDSLNVVIDGLNRTLVEVTLIDIRENHKIAEENRKRILQNALLEIIENLTTIGDWELTDRAKLLDDRVPVSRLSIVRLKDSQFILLNSEINAGISIIIRRIESINIALEAFRLSKPNSKERENNLDVMFSLLPELKKNLKYTFDKTKLIFPEFEVKFNNNGKLETW